MQRLQYAVPICLSNIQLPELQYATPIGIFNSSNISNKRQYAKFVI